MADSKAKDPLAEALRRAEEAIQKTNRSKQPEDDGIGTELDLPEESGDSYQPAADFGAVKLDQGAGSLELESPANAISKVASPSEPSNIPAPEPLPIPKPPPKPRSKPRSKPKNPPAFSLRIPREEQPKRTFPVKIFMVVLGVLCLIGACVFGYLQWQKSMEDEKMAQLKALDQASLESMKTEAAIKEKLGAN